MPGKMKRKGCDEVYEDFSDLSLSAPATKIRRLDAVLPPIMEDRFPIGGSVLEPRLLEGDMDNAMPELALATKKAVFPPMVNEERALVLYKPVHSHIGGALKMDPELISGLKNPSFWSWYQNLVDDEFVAEQESSSSINSLAVIPWVPSQFSAPGVEVSTSESAMLDEPMQVGADGESMEVDGDHGQVVDADIGPGSFPQRQQHCMIPEHFRLTSAPVLGSW